MNDEKYLEALESELQEVTTRIKRYHFMIEGAEKYKADLEKDIARLKKPLDNH